MGSKNGQCSLSNHIRVRSGKASKKSSKIEALGYGPNPFVSLFWMKIRNNNS
jgi:hypothetical protein